MGNQDETKATFAERYESVLVPVIFVPWAEELIRRSKPQSGEHILDLGCGTGVVTRQVSNMGLTFGRLTAVDHSAEMLAVARQHAGNVATDIEWVEADAAHLPFDDNSFDLAFCQQALQFFPDRPAALRELRRVLCTGGRVTCCVQRELDVNPMLRAQANALEAHVGAKAGAAVRAICSLSDGNEIRTLFEDAGFHDVEIHAVTLDLHHPDARAFAAGAMGGMHTGDKLSGLAEDSIKYAIDAFLAGLGDCYDGTAMRFPHASHVIVARA